MRRLRNFRRPLLAIALSLGLCAALVLWLGKTESGLRTVLSAVEALSGKQVHIGSARGQLLGDFSIDTLRWQNDTLRVEIEQMQLAWTPAALWQNRVQIEQLSAQKIAFTQLAATPPAPAPQQLQLPLAIKVNTIAIAEVTYAALTVRDIAASFSSDGWVHQLQDVHAQLADVWLSGQGRLNGAAPTSLEAAFDLTGQVQAHPLRLALQVSGTLERVQLDAQAKQGLSGNAQVVLTPFAASSLSSGRLALTNLNPASWHEDAPTAQLDLRAVLEEKHAARLQLENHQPGTLDQQRLPLRRLLATVGRRGEVIQIDAVQASLLGGASIAGSGEWQQGVLSYSLAAQQLDVSQFSRVVRATRLNGSISGVLGADAQTLKASLSGAGLSLSLDASAKPASIDVTQFVLASDGAWVEANARLSRQTRQEFSVQGVLRQFDLSRFAKTLPTQINGRFSSTGYLQPSPVLNAQFELSDSRVNGQPLAGQGQMVVDWPRIPRMDVALQAGANHFKARGAFGRPGEHLQLALNAPNLSPFALEGDLTAHLDLSGTSTRPEFALQADAARVGLPKQLRLSGVSLRAGGGSQANSPLNLALEVATLETPTQPSWIKSLKIKSSGTNRQHQLEASAGVSQHVWQLAAQGQLDVAKEAWQGQLLKLNMQDAAHQPRLHLANAAPLSLSRHAWSFGPARVEGDERQAWQATLAGNADNKKLQASLTAQGGQLGKVEATVKAGMQGAWALDELAAWQGALQLDVTDLAWLASVLGDGWQSGGQLKGELQLRGTPAHPVSSGQLNGRDLSFYLPEQGLRLNRGKLDVALQNNRLRVNTLVFESPLRTPPKTVRLNGGAEVAQLTQTPGRLEISGETELAQQAADNHAVLAIKLDRLGLFQQPDQWIVVSGNSQLTWQAAALTVRGQFAVDAGYWQLAAAGAPSLSEDVVLKGGEQGAAPRLRPNLNLDVSIATGKYLYFSGAGLSSRLTGALRLRAVGRDLPRASGSISTADGRFDAYGQSLAIEKGVLTFQGLLENPALDVRAVRKGLPVEAGVQIGGTAQRPTVKLISDPNVPDPEKLSWLVLGRATDQASSGDASLLFAAAGGLFGNNSGKLVQQLKNSFGVDTFEIRQGDLGSNSARQMGSRVAGSTTNTYSTGDQILSVGKRLSKNTLLSYENSLGKAESVVKLTVDVTRRVALIGRAGSDNALDVFYTFRSAR